MTPVPEGTLLFSFKLSIGKVAVTARPLYTNEAIAALVPREPTEVDRDYLRFALMTIDATAESSHAVKGRTLNRESLRALPVPWCQPGEQHRIAARLTAHLAAVAQARAAADLSMSRAASVFATELRRSMSPGPGWRSARLHEIVEVQLGKMLSPASRLGVRPVPYLRNANVQWGRFDLSDVAEMDFDERQERKFRLRRGDVMACEGGEPGRAAVWDGRIDRICYQKSLHRLRPLDGAIDPAFLMYRLWLGASRGEFADEHAKTTIAHLPAVRLATVTVDHPLIDEQRRIASHLDAVRNAANRARIAVGREIDAIDSLSAALLRQAFAASE